jgi:hypothetical protein
MPDADGRMTRDEMEDAEEVVALSAKIAMMGAGLLALPAASFVWGRARGFWMGQINVLGLESLLANMAFVGVLGITAVSALFAVEALWHGRAKRVRPAIAMHCVALVASGAVAVGVVAQTYRWLFDSGTALIAFIVYMAMIFALLGLAGLIYNLVVGMRTQEAIDRAIRAAMKS